MASQPLMVPRSLKHPAAGVDSSRALERMRGESEFPILDAIVGDAGRELFVDGDGDAVRVVQVDAASVASDADGDAMGDGDLVRPFDTWRCRLRA